MFDKKWSHYRTSVWHLACTSPQFFDNFIDFLGLGIRSWWNKIPTRNTSAICRLYHHTGVTYRFSFYGFCNVRRWFAPKNPHVRYFTYIATSMNKKLFHGLLQILDRLADSRRAPFEAKNERFVEQFYWLFLTGEVTICNIQTHATRILDVPFFESTVTAPREPLDMGLASVTTSSSCAMPCTGTLLR